MRDCAHRQALGLHSETRKLPSHVSVIGTTAVFVDLLAGAASEGYETSPSTSCHLLSEYRPGEPHFVTSPKKQKRRERGGA